VAKSRPRGVTRRTLIGVGAAAVFVGVVALAMQPRTPPGRSEGPDSTLPESDDVPPLEPPASATEATLPAPFRGSHCAWSASDFEVRFCAQAEESCKTAIEAHLKPGEAKGSFSCVPRPRMLHCFVSPPGAQGGPVCFSNEGWCHRRRALATPPLSDSTLESRCRPQRTSE
jgi:hypothetical protein